MSKNKWIYFVRGLHNASSISKLKCIWLLAPKNIVLTFVSIFGPNALKQFKTFTICLTTKFKYKILWNDSANMLAYISVSSMQTASPKN
jgi:hypothetical protein